jgi:hypothetical protein
MQPPVQPQSKQSKELGRLDPVESPLPDIILELKTILNQAIVAFAVTLLDPHDLDKYIQGSKTPEPNTEKRIRNLYRIVRLLKEHDDDSTILNWFLGMNPQLNDDSPLECLHKDPNGEGFQRVSEAAKYFVITG